MTDLATQNQERLCEMIDRQRADLAFLAQMIVELQRSLRESEKLVEQHAQNEATR